MKKKELLEEKERKIKKNNEKSDEKEVVKDSKKKFLIIGIVILVLVVALVVVFVVRQRQMEFKYDWEEIYYNYLKIDIVDKGMSEDGEIIFQHANVRRLIDPEISFVEEGLEYPIMIVESDEDEEKIEAGSKELDDQATATVYTIINGKSVTYSRYYNGEIVMLYNIEKEEYGWYVEQESDGYVYYTSVKEIAEKLIERESQEDKNSAIDTKSYYFQKDSKEYNNTFIKIDDAELTSFSLKKNLDKLELKKLLDKTINTIKDKEKYISSDDKKEVKEKLTAIEEEKKKEEEAKEKALEEAKKIEEAKKQQASYIKAGNYTIAYGTYKSIIAETPITITLNNDGTCSYIGADPHTGNGSYNTSCTYQVVRMDVYGYGEISDCLKLNLSNGVDATFEVQGNNSFGSDWLGFAKN